MTIISRAGLDNCCPHEVYVDTYGNKNYGNTYSNFEFMNNALNNGGPYNNNYIAEAIVFVKKNALRTKKR